MTKKTDEKTVNKKTDIFMAKLAQTGVSKKFLESARPSVERLFAQVPEENLNQAMEHFLDTAGTQAQTETHLEAALEETKKLMEISQRVIKNIEQGQLQRDQKKHSEVDNYLRKNAVFGTQEKMAC